MKYAALLCLIAPGLALAASPTPEDLARCAAISTNETRLACFDALTRAGAAHAPNPAPLAPTAPVAPSAPVAASAPQAPVAPQAAAAPAAPAALSDPNDPRNFGLSPAQRHVAVVGPKREEARIVSMAPNQAGHATVVLDNGQTWAVLDDDGWISSGDQVSIKRASLGSYILMTPSHHTYRVHRVQ